MDDGLWIATSNLLWFGSGVLFMYALCRYGLVNISRHEHPRPHVGGAMNEASKRPRPRPRIHWVRGVIFLVVGVVVFGFGVRVGYELLRNQVDCFDEYAVQNHEAQTSRSTASEILAAAEKEVFEEISELLNLPPNAPEKTQRAAVDELRDALDDYIAAQDSLQREREANPYPEPPREVCGD